MLNAGYGCGLVLFPFGPRIFPFLPIVDCNVSTALVTTLQINRGHRVVRWGLTTKTENLFFDTEAEIPGIASTFLVFVRAGEEYGQT